MVITIGSIIIFLLAAQGWAEEWIFYASTSTRDAYYDKSSIEQVNKGKKRVWVKATLNDEGQKEAFSYLTTIDRRPDHPAQLSHVSGLHEIDCSNQKIMDISLIIYDIKMNVLYSRSKGETDQWMDILPDSVGELLKDIVCEEPIEPKESAVAEFVDSHHKPVESDSKLNVTKAIPQEVLQDRVNQWLYSWKSGDWETYRSCYASDFKSKGMTLHGWISHKTKVHRKSKNIHINIDQLQISVNGDMATVVFTQYYRSSILKESGKKILELRKINDEWKIVKERMN